MGRRGPGPLGRSFKKKVLRDRIGRDLPKSAREFLDAPRNDPEWLLESNRFLNWRQEPQGAAGYALMAGQLAALHGDPWMKDFAAGSYTGAGELAEASEANLLGDYTLALDKSERSIQKFRLSGNAAGEYRARRERNYAMQRRFEGSACLSDAEEMLPRVSVRRYAWLEAEFELAIGTCRTLTGNSLATVANERALEIATRTKYQSLELKSLASVLRGRYELGLPDSLWRPAWDGLTIYWNGAYRPVRAFNILVNLSQAAESSRLLKAAYLLRKEAVSILDEDPNLRQRALAHSTLASSAQLAGDWRASNAEYSTAEALFQQAGDPASAHEYRAEAILARAKALTENGDAGEAIDILNRLRREQPRLSVALAEIRYHQIAGDAYQRRNRPREAEAEYQQAVTLAEERLPAASPANRASVLRSSESAFKALTTARIRHADWTGALTIWERFRGGAALPANQDPNASFLIFADLPAGIAAWLVDGTQITGEWLKSDTSELTRICLSFARQLSHPESEPADWQTNARWLYDALLGPFSTRIAAGKVLVVIPDGPVVSVPFRALMDRSGNILGDRCPVVVGDSLTAWRERESRPVDLSARSSTLVVADPALRGAVRHSYPPLPAAAQEAAIVANEFPGARIFESTAATAGPVLRWAPTSAIFHFAGHGIARGGSGALLLAPETEGNVQLLEASMIAESHWPGSELVVLSACASGVGETASFPNPDSLVRAFLSAGTRRVVAARWPVDSAAALDFMRRFYFLIARGTRPSMATSMAASEVRRARPHPHDWAVFEEFGFR